MFVRLCLLVMVSVLLTLSIGRLGSLIACLLSRDVVRLMWWCLVRLYVWMRFGRLCWIRCGCVRWVLLLFVCLGRCLSRMLFRVSSCRVRRRVVRLLSRWLLWMLRRLDIRMRLVGVVGSLLLMRMFGLVCLRLGRMLRCLVWLRRLCMDMWSRLGLCVRVGLDFVMLFGIFRLMVLFLCLCGFGLLVDFYYGWFLLYIWVEWAYYD